MNEVFNGSVVAIISFVFGSLLAIYEKQRMKLNEVELDVTLANFRGSPNRVRKLGYNRIELERRSAGRLGRRRKNSQQQTGISPRKI